MSKTILFDLRTLEEALSKKPAFQQLKSVCVEQKAPILLVGGVIRDWLYSEKVSSDWDMVVPAEMAKPLSKKIAAATGGKLITLDDHFGIYRIILIDEKIIIDVASCIGKDIKEDLLRRDFTINAMAYDVKASQFFDPTGGLEDLKNGLLRMVSEHNMLDDPLRLLRIFRIAADMGIEKIDPATLQVASKHGTRILKVATERIHYELMRLFSAPKCFRQVQLMRETRVLEHLFPELSAMHPIPKNRYHHLDLFDHTLELLNQAEIHFDDLPDEIQNYLNEFFNPFIKNMAVLRLSCLFHDVGKPATMARGEAPGEYHFYGHENVSAEIVMGIGPRMLWGRELTERVSELCRWHLYPGNLLEPEVTEKAWRKYFRRVGHLLPELIPLAIADRYSAQGPEITEAELQTKKHGLIGMWEKFKQFQTIEPKQPKLLTGEEVMTTLGLEPGREVGAILKAFNTAYLNGDISTREEALKWLENHKSKSVLP